MNDAIDVIVVVVAVDVIVGDVFNEKLTTRHSKFKSAGIFFCRHVSWRHFFEN